MSFMSSIISNHESECNKQQKDLITHGFDSYLVYLEDIEQKDTRQLT